MRRVSKLFLAGLVVAGALLAMTPRTAEAGHRCRSYIGFSIGVPSYYGYQYQDPYHYYSGPGQIHYGPHGGYHNGPHFHWSHGYHWGPHWQDHSDLHGFHGHFGL